VPIRRRVLVTVPALVAALAPVPSRGGPLDDPHVGGVGFSGPTTGDITAVFWNPAALGMLQGSEVTVVVSEQLAKGSIQRAPIDGAGQPGGGRSFPAVTERDRRRSLSWPPGPGSFIGIGTSVGTRFSLGVALYAPYAQRTTFDATTDGQEPTRYHLVAADLRNVALTTALAFRIGNELRFGVAPGLLFSTGRLVFDEDTALESAPPGPSCGATPCGVENPAAAARYQVGSGLGLLDASVSFTVAAGLHYRRGRFEAGVSYASPPLGSGAAFETDRADVGAPARLGAGASLCPSDRPSPCMFGRVGYDLPDTVVGGVTWHFSATTALTGIVRWLTFSRHDRIGVRIVGAAGSGLRAVGAPDSVTLYRGFRDVIEGRVRIERVIGTWLRLGAALRADSGAVAADRQAPGAVGGPALEPALMAELRLPRPSWLRLTAGYALTVIPTVHADPSVFDPAQATACAAADGDLLTPACGRRLAGSARPTAAGDYSLLGHTASLNATVRF
jgi:long-subunit fatty acid transport protein